jgi:hypothetical protein
LGTATSPHCDSDHTSISAATVSSRTSATGVLHFVVGEAGMFECFLLVGKVGATWVPLLAIPTVITGGLASIWLILSGIKGIIAQSIHPRREVARPANPGRVVQWIGKRPGQLRNTG